jgi:ribosome-binding ATPase YchF (GTP1/OBG family)
MNLQQHHLAAVADANRLADTHGNILPDVYLIKPRSTVEDLARDTNSELAKDCFMQ